MDEREVLLECERPLGRREPEDLIRLRGPDDRVACDVPLPAADVGEGLRVAEELRRPSELLFGALPLSDVPRIDDGPAHSGGEAVQPVLHDVVRRPGPDVLRRRFFVERPRHDDHRRVSPFRPHHAERLPGAKRRQGMIREYDVRDELVQGVTQRRFAVHALAREREARAP